MIHEHYYHERLFLTERAKNQQVTKEELIRQLTQEGGRQTKETATAAFHEAVKAGYLTPTEDGQAYTSSVPEGFHKWSNRAKQDPLDALQEIANRSTDHEARELAALVVNHWRAKQ